MIDTRTGPCTTCAPKPHYVALHKLPEGGGVRGACSASGCPCKRYTPEET